MIIPESHTNSFKMIPWKDVDVFKFVDRLDQDLDQFMDRFKDLFGHIWTGLWTSLDQLRTVSRSTLFLEFIFKQI